MYKQCAYQIYFKMCKAAQMLSRIIVFSVNRTSVWLRQLNK